MAAQVIKHIGLLMAFNLLSHSEQWGKIYIGYEVQFPITYNKLCYCITFGINYSGSQYSYDQVKTYDTTGFITFQEFGKNTAGNLVGMWIVLGV